MKVWDEASLTELRSLGSHTGSVTDVVLLSRKQYGSLGRSTLAKEAGLHIALSSPSDCRSRGCRFVSQPGHVTSVEIHHKMFSTPILPHPLIQGGQLSVTAKSICA